MVNFFRDLILNIVLTYSIDQWTLTHWERTSAVQCCHNQPLIDKAIPMYFKSPKVGDQAGMSQILISDKAGASSGERELGEIQRDHASIAPNYRGLPYIAILVDLGMVTPNFEVRVDSSESKDTCLRIYARGLDETTYPFLETRTDLIRILGDLYKRQSAPSSRSIQRELEDQVQFGRSSEPRCMDLKQWVNQQ